jgi:hypothetical protein
VSEASPGDTRKLFQARYALTALGVETRFTARGDALKGEISPEEQRPLANPVTGEAIGHLSFTVDLGARLRVDDPPALRGIEVDGETIISLSGLLDDIAAGLDARFARVSALCEQVQRVGFEARIDAERMLGIARVDLDAVGTVVLEASQRGVLARQLIPAFGDRTPLSLGELPVDLEQIRDRVDLELALAARAEEALAHRPTRGADAAAPDAVELAVEASPEARSAARPADPSRAPALQALAQYFGSDALLRPGFTIGRPIQVGGEAARFIAEHVKGQQFKASVRTRREILWQGDVELSQMGSLEDFVTDKLGGTPAVAGVADDLAPELNGGERTLVAGLLPPVANETWVMDVRVEDDDGVEVRYRGLDVGGTAFGAPRVLPKAAFESSYLSSSNGYRMLIRVTRVEDNVVSYQRLDAQRQPVGGTRQSPLIVFLANFVAEAAAY